MLFCFDDNMITKEIEEAMKRVDKDISNIHEVYIIYCYIATMVLSTINSCFLLLGLVKNSPILLTTWLIITGIGNWVSTVWTVNDVLREYGSSGEDVSVNAVIIPKNWWAIPSEGQSPEEGYCSPILRNDDRIH